MFLRPSVGNLDLQSSNVSVDSLYQIRESTEKAPLLAFSRALQHIQELKVTCGSTHVESLHGIAKMYTDLTFM